jgi:hypothetical protein
VEKILICYGEYMGRNKIISKNFQFQISNFRRRSGVVPRSGTFVRNHDFAITLNIARYPKHFGSGYNPEPATGV